MLKSTCRDCSTKSSTDFAHYYLWLFSTLWWNTSHPFQNLQKNSNPPPPPHLLSASVMSPFHIFTFTWRKQLAAQILKKLKFLLISQYQPSRCWQGLSTNEEKRGDGCTGIPLPSPLLHLPGYCVSSCNVPSMNLLVSQIMCFLHPFLCLYTPRKKWYK